jgi:hypothetical protein
LISWDYFGVDELDNMPGSYLFENARVAGTHFIRQTLLVLLDIEVLVRAG